MKQESKLKISLKKTGMAIVFVILSTLLHLYIFRNGADENIRWVDLTISILAYTFLYWQLLDHWVKTTFLNPFRVPIYLILAFISSSYLTWFIEQYF